MSQKASAADRAQGSEGRPHQPGQEVFKAILSEDVDWKPFPAFPPAIRLANEHCRGSAWGNPVEIPALSSASNKSMR